MSKLSYVLLLPITGCIYSTSNDETAVAEDTEAIISSPIVSIESQAPSSDQDLNALILVPSTSSDGGRVDYRYRWWQNEVEVTDISDQPTVPYEMTVPDDIWRVEVWGWQGDLEGFPGEDDVVVTNLPPSVTVSLEPEYAVTLDDLVTTTIVEDPELSEVTLNYNWYRDGVLVEDKENATLSAEQTARDESWTVVVDATDEHGGTATGVASLSIQNSAPYLVGLVLDPSDPEAGVDLGCVPVGAEDPDGDEIVFNYQWTLNTGSSSCNCHEDPPPSILTSSFVSEGYVISCEATPTDGELSGSTVYSEEVTVGAASD